VKSVKDAVKNLLRMRGYALVPYDEYEDRLRAVREHWLRTLDVRTVIDVGASDGGFARRIRATLPHASLFCFEPLPKPFDALRARFAQDPNFRAAQMAVSNAPGMVSFQENASSGSSSLLDMADLHREAYPATRSSTAIAVECTTLDRHFAATELQPRVLLKMDVQGAERLVLEGARATLRRVDIVFSEMSFFELYRGQVLANELIRILEAAGFSLVGIENVSRSLVDGRFLQCDAYFLSAGGSEALTAGRR
jgi:FkbM family methyltransferase